MSEIPSQFLYHREKLEKFVEHFDEEVVNKILQQESNIETVVYRIIPKGDAQFETKEEETIIPPQPFYNSIIVKYLEGGVEKVIFCLSTQGKIREVSRPRGRTESQASLDYQRIIRTIMMNEHEKSKTYKTAWWFIGYLLLLIPVCVVTLYFLKNFSNRYHVRRLHGMIGEESFRSFYDYTLNPFREVVERQKGLGEELREVRSTKEITKKLVELDKISKKHRSMI